MSNISNIIKNMSNDEVNIIINYLDQNNKILINKDSYENHHEYYTNADSLSRLLARVNANLKFSRKILRAVDEIYMNEIINLLISFDTEMEVEMEAEMEVEMEVEMEAEMGYSFDENDIDTGEFEMILD
jgi:hypothetical protein